MRDKRAECGCHRKCSTLPHECTRPCRWPDCLTEAEHQQLVAELEAEAAGPLVIVRVGPAAGGYFVGPFTPAEGAAWREENVTIPGMQWAIVPLLPPAARPAGADLFRP